MGTARGRERFRMGRAVGYPPWVLGARGCGCWVKRMAALGAQRRGQACHGGQARQAEWPGACPSGTPRRGPWPPRPCRRAPAALRASPDLMQRRRSRLRHEDCERPSSARAHAGPRRLADWQRHRLAVYCRNRGISGAACGSQTRVALISLLPNWAPS